MRDIIANIVVGACILSVIGMVILGIHAAHKLINEMSLGLFEIVLLICACWMIGTAFRRIWE